jgi:hypothetical protein
MDFARRKTIHFCVGSQIMFEPKILTKDHDTESVGSAFSPAPK